MTKIEKLMEIQSTISKPVQDYVANESASNCGCGGGATNCNGNF